MIIVFFACVPPIDPYDVIFMASSEFGQRKGKRYTKLYSHVRVNIESLVLALFRFSLCYWI